MFVCVQACTEQARKYKAWSYKRGRYSHSKKLPRVGMQDDQLEYKRTKKLVNFSTGADRPTRERDRVTSVYSVD